MRAPGLCGSTVACLDIYAFRPQPTSSLSATSWRKYLYRTLSTPSTTLASSVSIDRRGGPEIYTPSAVNVPLWQGQMNLSCASTQRIEHPRCGQTGERIRNWPDCAGSTYTAVSA